MVQINLKGLFHGKIGGMDMLEEKLDKKTYIGIVKFTLESMLNLSKEDKEYNLQADVAHYYDSTIKAEGIITIDEFFALCIEMGIK